MNAGMDQRLGERLVGFRQPDVLAHHGNGDLMLRMLQRIDQAFPHRQIGCRRRKFELVANQVIQMLLVQHRGNLVDGIFIPDRDHAIEHHVREQ